MAEETYTEVTPTESEAPAPRQPNVIEVARQQAEGLVRNQAAQMNLDLQQRIDELLNLQANISRASSALQHYIGEFADRCNEAFATSSKIKAEIEAMASPFAKTPPATITQVEGEK